MDMTYCSHNPDRSVLIASITWHFEFHPVNVSILRLKYECCAWSESRFACYSHCDVTWCPWPRELSPHNTRRKGTLRSWRATSQLQYRGVWDRQNKSTTIKHTYNEFEDFIDNCEVAFDTDDWWNQPKTVTVIGLESMAPCARLSYTRDYLPRGICSLIKPAAMTKLISFPTKTIAVML